MLRITAKSAAFRATFASRCLVTRRFASTTPTKKVLVVGAGRVGRSITHMLSAEDYQVRICDASPKRAAAVRDELLNPDSGVKGSPITVKAPPKKAQVDAFSESVTSRDALVSAMSGVGAVISAAPFAANPLIAEAASIAGVHYLDLTEDVAVTQKVKEMSTKTKRSAFVPQCGVAPGFITLAAMHVVSKFDKVEELSLRVGALPEQPNNRLKYNLTWSTEGLVNEYIHPCEALREGKLVLLEALEGREEIVIDGVTYEAFNTSGGVGTLCHSLSGKVNKLDYKTLRYPGHVNLIRFLLDDLRFKHNPEELVKIFHRSIPGTLDDFVIISVRALGSMGGQYMEKTFWRKVTGKMIGRHFFTGIEVATAAGVCGIADRLLHGQLPQHGLIKIEDVTYNNFMHSPFGRYYAKSRENL
jgi:saccharopine dehydrogenase-like NADP-dependent oxidoreductase